MPMRHEAAAKEFKIDAWRLIALRR